MGIACGMSHVIVYNKKEAYGWGDHHSGALGYEPTNIVNPAMPRKLPLLIAREERIDDVSCGNNTTVLNISGSFYCVGDNSCRQLGLMFKKPYFEFQKLELQKNNNNTHKVSSQLLKAKTGNRFTIALDSHGTLFGAGELDQFGLALCDDHSSPGGLMVIAKTEDTNSFLEDVADFYCSNNLIIKSKAGQFVKLAGNSTSAFLLKDHLSTEVISDCALCTLIKDKHDTYKWHENVLVKLNKNEEQLIICQQNGCLVVIEHEDETNSEGELSHMREDSCSEQSKEVR
jgi:alpha-tubulin suppressor-like RCC1 family protein